MTEEHTGNLATFDFPLLCIDFRFLVMITGKKSLPAFSRRQLFCLQTPVLLVSSSLPFHRLASRRNRKLSSDDVGRGKADRKTNQTVGMNHKYC